MNAYPTRFDRSEPLRSLEMTAVVGVRQMLAYLPSTVRSWRLYGNAIAVLILLVNAYGFTSAYFGRYRAESRDAFQHGMADLVTLIDKVGPSYDYVAFAPRISAPYIHFLFYARRDPTEYQVKGQVDNVIWDKRRLEHPGRYLVVYKAWEKQAQNNVRYVIRDPDGEEMMRVIEHYNTGE